MSAVTLYWPGGNRTWSFYYSGSLLASIVFPAPVAGGSNPRISFGYDGNTNLTDLIDKNGNRWHYVYGDTWAASNLIGVREIHEPTTTGYWNAYHYTTLSYGVYTQGSVSTWNLSCAITDQLGRQWQHIYYNGGSQSTQYFPYPIAGTVDPYVSSANATYSDHYVWNPADCTLQTYTDKRGSSWNYTYDANNRGLMQTEQNPLGQLSAYLYDANQRLVRTIDPNGDRMLYTYNGNLDLTQTTIDPVSDPYDGSYYRSNAAAITTNNTYYPWGDIYQTWSGNDAATQYTWDGYGDLQYVTDPAGNVFSSRFDSLNNKLFETEPAPGGTTSYTYDNWNRLTMTTNADGTYATDTYDNDSNVITSQDANGWISGFGYDGLNRRTSATQPVDTNPYDSITVNTGYDLVGNPTTLVNGRGKTSTTVFNERHEPVEVTYPDGSTRRSAYDPNGNKSQMWDGKGRLTNLTYDTANRLVATNYAVNTPYVGSVTYTWRPDGLRTSMTDYNGTTTWSYNGAKQLLSNYQASGQTVNYTYDPSGRRRTMQLDSELWTYNYNPDLQLQDIEQSVGDSIAATYTYNPNGTISARTMGSNIKTYYAYDARDRVTSISHRGVFGGTETEQQRLDYAYDSVGNVLSYANVIDGVNTQDTSYQYDGADRLINESRLDGNWNVFANSYTYDKNNNRTSIVRNGTTYPYTVDDNDKLYSGDGVSFNNYDADGLFGTSADVSETVYWYYDGLNRLYKTISPTSTSQYAYDGDGHRIVRNVNGQVTRYVYDGASLIGTINPDGTMSYFIPGVGATWYTGKQYYFEENALGSTVAVRSGSGNLVSHTDYDGYGWAYNADSGEHTFLGFAGSHGYVFDDDTGCMMVGQRYYIPWLGRFATPDPTGFGGGLNQYAYCNDNPVTGLDPTGLDEFKLPESPGPNGENMPDGWTEEPKDPEHGGNRETWIGPNKDEQLAYDRRSGGPGWRDKDHWHLQHRVRGKWKDDTNVGRDGGHLSPGDTVTLRPPDDSRLNKYIGSRSDFELGVGVVVTAVPAGIALAVTLPEDAAAGVAAGVARLGLAASRVGLATARALGGFGARALAGAY